VIENARKIIRFIVIALSALGIDQIVEVLKQHGHHNLAKPLEFLAYFLLAVDVIWFILFVVIEATQSITAQLRGRTLQVIAAVTLFFIGAAASPYLKMGLVELAQVLAAQFPDIQRPPAHVEDKALSDRANPRSSSPPLPAADHIFHGSGG
jgi:hypothetical protein